MRKIILSLCVVLLMSSCKEEAKIPENFDYGSTENGVYKNEFFNFEISFDEEWSVQSREQMAKISKSGQDIMAGDNQNLKNTLKASQVNVADLFTIFKFPIGSVPKDNPSLVINAENLKSFPEVRTPKDYIIAARKLLDQTPLILIYKKEPYAKTIGGKEFMAMEIYNQDYNITQEYFATLRNGFAISIVASYNSEPQREDLYKMLDNLKFN